MSDMAWLGSGEEMPVETLARQVLGQRPVRSQGLREKLGGWLGGGAAVAPGAVAVERARAGGPPLPVATLPFLGMARPAGWVPWLRLASLNLPENPQQVVRRLNQARTAQARAAAGGLAAWLRAQELRRVGLRAWLLTDLTGCFPARAAQLLAAGGTDQRQLEAATAGVAQELRGIRRASGSGFEALIGRRIHASLTLLLSPSVRSRVPEAPQLRPRAHRLVALTRALSPLVDAAEQLDRRRERMNRLEGLAAAVADRGPLDALIDVETAHLQSAADRLEDQAGDLAAPHRDWFSEPTAPVSGGPRLVRSARCPGAACDTAFLDRLQDLNLETLTQLVELAQRVERGLELKPMPLAAA